MTQTNWPIRRVGLRVRDLEGSLEFYQRLGLNILREDVQTAQVGLGVGTLELLTLRHTPQALPRPAHTAGLYHFALLLPDEIELATFLRYSLSDHVPFGHALDHSVSQAIYLNDPEGNGIEIYADRPRSQWPTDDKEQLFKASRRLKARRLLEQARSHFDGLPAETVLGHIHLNVYDLEKSTTFYKQTFGLQLISHFVDQVSFISWDNYHHHFGLNVWAGPHVSAHTSEVSGLDFFEIAHASLQPGLYEDPNNISIIVPDN
jgi:catechol 2,3-dioxygenase